MPSTTSNEVVRRWFGGPRPPHGVRAAARLAPRGIPGLREGLRGLLGRVFDPPPAQLPGADARGPDPGLCGPGSASWKLLGEPDALVGGVRALLLQTLHPHAMAGVADHSSFRTDPLGRLRSTASYVTVSTFGTTRQALDVARTVRRTHERVHGTAPDGTRYDAADPRLLTWVSVALTSSFLAADRLWSPDPLDEREADAFVAEQSRIAALLDPRVDLGTLGRHPAPGRAVRSGELRLPLLAERLPTSRSGLVAVLAGFAPELHAGRQARQAVRFLRSPPITAPVKAAYLWLFAGAAGSLATEDRERLALPAGRAAGLAGVAATAGAVALLRGISGRSGAARAAEQRIRAAA